MPFFDPSPILQSRATLQFVRVRRCAHRHPWRINSPARWVRLPLGRLIIIDGFGSAREEEYPRNLVQLMFRSAVWTCADLKTLFQVFSCRLRWFDLNEQSRAPAGCEFVRPVWRLSLKIVNQNANSLGKPRMFERLGRFHHVWNRNTCQTCNYCNMFVTL